MITLTYHSRQIPGLLNAGKYIEGDFTHVGGRKVRSIPLEHVDTPMESSTVPLFRCLDGPNVCACDR